MKILVLEDNSIRIEIFEETLPQMHKNSEIFYAKSVDDAKELFRTEGKFDVYYLDHDLGGLENVNVEEYETGSTFAQFLVDNRITGLDEDIIIHSWNIIGAENMENIFKKSEKMPFNHYLLRDLAKQSKGE